MCLSHRAKKRPPYTSLYDNSARMLHWIGSEMKKNDNHARSERQKPVDTEELRRTKLGRVRRNSPSHGITGIAWP